MIDVRRLRILSAVVETGSVVGAAGLLNFTSSSISQQITALERETGTVLFERAGRGVRPTDAALLLNQHAAVVLGAINDAEVALADFCAGHVGRIRVAAFPTAGSSLVPGALAAFEAVHPSVSLELVVVEVDEAVESLRRGATDVAVVVQSPDGEDLTHGAFASSHLFTDPFRIVLPLEHPLAARDTIELAELAYERWIGVTSCPGYCGQVVDEACALAGFHPSYALHADEYPTVQGFVAAGLGIALVPILSLGTSVHPGVVVRKVEGAQPQREVWAITRPGIEAQPLVQTMLTCLVDSAAQFALASV